MVLGGLGGRWVVMFERRAYLASVKAIWVVLGGLRRRWVVILGRRAYLASV